MARERRRQVLQKQCEVCQQTYTTRSTAPKRERYCSEKCATRHYNQVMWRKYAHKRRKWQPVERACVICGTAFMARDSRHVCCSLPCNEDRQDARRRDLALRNWDQTPRPCAECGKEFVPGRYGWHRQKYCSRQCGASARIKQQPKRKSRNLRESLRRQLLQRANGRCERCGVVPPRIEAHHINWNWKDNELGNLIALCGPCHRAMEVTCRVENGVLVLISAQWQRFPPERIRFEEV